MYIHLELFAFEATRRIIDCTIITVISLITTYMAPKQAIFSLSPSRRRFCTAWVAICSVAFATGESPLLGIGAGYKTVAAFPRHTDAIK